MHAISKRYLCNISHHIPKQLKIGVIGGSISGLFSGVALQSLGFNVQIFERGSNAKKGAGYIVTPPLMEYLEKFEIIDSCNFDFNFLKSHQSNVIYEDDSIETKTHEKYPRLQTSWDCLYWSAFNILIKNNKDMNTKIIQSHKKMIDIQNNGINNMMKIYFEDNTSYECDIVIGCDGLGSDTRSYISANKNNIISYGGYNLWRGVVEASKINEESKLYPVRDGNKFIVFNGNNSQCLCFMIPNYYNTSDHLYNWAWYVHYDYENELKNEILIDRDNYQHRYAIQRGDVRDEVCDKLYKYAQDTLPSSLSELVSLTPDPFCQIVWDYKTKSMYQYFENGRDDDKEYKEGGIVLVGDSAFVLRPHTTRGVSKASADVMCLYDNLKKYKNNQLSLYQAMNEYNSERLKIGNEASDIGIELAKKLLSNDESMSKKEWRGSYIRIWNGPHVTINT